MTSGRINQITTSDTAKTVQWTVTMLRLVIRFTRNSQKASSAFQAISLTLVKSIYPKINTPSHLILHVAFSGTSYLQNSTPNGIEILGKLFPLSNL
jgi:hypothetical protein